MSFYRRWIVACTAGELIGIGSATGVAVAFHQLVGEPQSLGARLLTLAAFAVVGAVEGTALAGFQWFELRKKLPRLGAGEWIGVTVAVAVAGWIVGMTPSLLISHESALKTTAQEQEPGLGFVLLMAGLAGGCAGFLFGVAQWFVLRRHAACASQWIWIHIPAWGLAMAAIFLGAALPCSDAPGWLIAILGAAGGVLGGLLLGAVTGLVAKNLRPSVDEQGWPLKGRVCAVTDASSGIEV